MSVSPNIRYLRNIARKNASSYPEPDYRGFPLPKVILKLPECIWLKMSLGEIILSVDQEPVFSS